MYVEHRPSPTLRPFVECFWTSSGPVDVRRVVPDGCLDLIFDRRTGGARVIGAMTRAVLVQGGEVDLVAVRFRPGEAPGLLGLPASELTDRAVDLDLVCAGLAAPVADAADPLAELSRRLVPRIGTRWADGRVRRAVRALTAGAGLRAVADEVGLGERQLERLFAERVGYGPKRFARVMRLQRALAAPADLATVAVRAGFADASHVVREVRALCGVAPGELFAERAAMSETSNPLERERSTAGATVRAR